MTHVATRYRVILPSAARGETSPFEVEGRLGHLPGLDQFVPTIIPTTGSVMALDPRAIVVESGTSVVVYTPRQVALDEFHPAFREWLRQHPRWGEPGCERDLAAAVRPERGGER